MPTGYTAAIADGITFEQYALICARAFGALVTMRDEPSDATIPDRFEPHDYNQKKLESTHAELNRILAMSPAQVDVERDRDYAREMESYSKRMSRATSLRTKYENMLASVRAWEAPTPDHVEYKSFMEDQIVKSIDFDCDTSHDAVPEKKSADGWLSIRLAELRRDIAYYENAHREEVVRTEKRNEWLKALRDSLSNPW
jgi:hypothetical protein